MTRRCFYSFHYKPDCQRAAQVRSIGSIEGNRPATDNEWEAITSGGDWVIKRWIGEQMQGKSCTIVLVGTKTADRKWINYEIEESWKKGMGVVGIHIHGLRDLNGFRSQKGANPFDYVYFDSKTKLSSIVKCYDPGGFDSKDTYAWIVRNLSNAVEEAINIRKRYPVYHS